MRARSLALLVLAATVVVAPRAHAQANPSSLFERYLDALREQAGIPGLSAAIVQDGRIVWERGFGAQDLEASIPAHPSTPYQVSDLTQTLAAALLLQCAERGQLDIDAPMRQWAPQFPEAAASVRHVLEHASGAPPGSTFKYDPTRFAQLTNTIDECANQPYRRALVEEILDRFAMLDAAPGHDLATPTSDLTTLFDDEARAKYAAVLQRLAVPYRVAGGKAVRADFPSRGIDAAAGLVASVRDLARFDLALDDGVLLTPDTLAVAWRNAAATSGQVMPTGLGWFVQSYGGQRIVWHYGMTAQAYSSLILKVPDKRLTLILLANSDGLSSPSSSSLSEGDVTSSPFARLFLRLFL